MVLGNPCERVIQPPKGLQPTGFCLRNGKLMHVIHFKQNQGNIWLMSETPLLEGTLLQTGQSGSESVCQEIRSQLLWRARCEDRSHAGVGAHAA